MTTLSSRKIIRNAIRDYISAGNVTNLNQVFISFPKRINYQEQASPGQLNRAAGVVHFAHEDESRLAWGGQYSGWKRVDYSVKFQIFHLSMEKTAENAMDSFDTIIDGVKALLRAGNHAVGLSDGSVWQIAEPAITVDYGEPWINGNGNIEIWASVDFTATQMINA